MKNMIIRSFAFLVAVMVVSPAVAADYVIHAGRLIDGVSDNTREKVSIIVEGDRIVSIESGFAMPDGDQQAIDLKEFTIMPGLMDMHVHLSMQYDLEPTVDSYTEYYQKDEAFFALKATQYARSTLDAGFTTVRDAGGPMALILRDAIAAGHIEGPRIFAAGTMIATTGGHADITNGYNKHFSNLMGDPGPKEGVVNGPVAARQAVRQRFKEGSNLIKITATGGIMSQTKSKDNPQFAADELTAIVETANDYGLTVAAHAHGTEGMKRAVQAGVTSIEHGTFMSDELMQLMKRKGTYYVPTITVHEWLMDEYVDTLPALNQSKVRAVAPQSKATFGKAYKAGVKVAFGTDAGVFPHGLNGREFIYMVDEGMPAMEAIQSATITAAKLLRIDDTLGSVEPGKIADLVAVHGDPLADIELMTDIRFVMKEGEVYKSP